MKQDLELKLKKEKWKKLNFQYIFADGGGFRFQRYMAYRLHPFNDCSLKLHYFSNSDEIPAEFTDSCV